MTRSRTSLDGPWSFQIDPVGASDHHHLADWRTITVPSPWQAEFDDLRHSSGVAWYRRRLEVPPADGAAVLHFGAVDHHATVWLNDVLLGEHEGGYLPFEFDLAGLLTGDDELVVRVEDPTDDHERYPDAVFSEVPHGKQSWYGPLSGIWQSVWIEQRASTHVRTVRIDPELATGEVRVQVALSRAADELVPVRLTVRDATGVEVADGRATVPSGGAEVAAILHVGAPRAWSPDDPYLYEVVVALVHDDMVVDEVVERIGFRTIEAVDGKLLLNGQPLFLRAALDQDYYPDTIATVPSVALLEDQARRAKELGLNCLRCHIKVPDPRYLDVADRFGLLVWAELPNWRHFTPAAAERARATFAGMVERDRNHPSIVAWTIVNEDWGTDLVHEAGHRAWLRDTYLWAKELDPTRLVIDNSACPPNFHVQTDVEDYHFYKAIPDRRLEWDRFVDGFAERAAPTFSPNGDAVRTGSEPLIVSEFGNWGLPQLDGLLDDDGRAPWWFSTGDEWDGGVVRPQGTVERFERWHLDRVFGDLRTFVEATQWQQYRALKYQIEAIRRRPEICGYVITELTDTHWEPNGLLDAHRRPKAFHDRMAAICGDTVVIPRWERVAYVAGETARVGVVVATGGRGGLESTVLRWRLAQHSGEVAVPDMAALDAKEVAELELDVPAGRATTVETLHLELWTADEVLATSSLELTIHESHSPRDDGTAVWSPDVEVARHLDAAGLRLVGDAAAADVVVTTTATDELVRHVRGGGRALLLVDRPGPLHDGLPGIHAVERRGGPWDGDWASTFAWLRRDRHTHALPGGPLLDEPFERVVPELVLDGLAPWEFETNVLAGIVVGWIHRPAGLAVRRHYGRGQVLVTTFRCLRDDPGADPTATVLLRSLVAAAADPG